MNGTERVRAALRGDPVGRIPAAFWFHFPNEDKRGEAPVRVHVDSFYASSIDYPRVVNEHLYHTDAVKTSSDWLHLRPETLSAPFYRQQLDKIKRFVHASGTVDIASIRAACEATAI